MEIKIHNIIDKYIFTGDNPIFGSNYVLYKHTNKKIGNKLNSLNLFILIKYQKSKCVSLFD